MVTVSIIAYALAYWTDAPLEHPATEVVAEAIGVSDMEHVACEVADKKAFPWLSGEVFS